MPFKVAVILALLMHFGLPCRQGGCCGAASCGPEAAACDAVASSCCGGSATAPAPVDGCAKCIAEIVCPLGARAEGCPPCCLPCPPAEPAAPSAPDRDHRGPIDREQSSVWALTAAPTAPIGRRPFETDAGTGCARTVPSGLRRALLCVWTT